MGMHFKLGLYEHQSAGAIGGLLDLLAAHPALLTSPNDIERIRITIYEPAFSIIGDPHKRDPRTRQSADHSMVYIVGTLLRKALLSRLAQEASAAGVRGQESGVRKAGDLWRDLMLVPDDYVDAALQWAYTANPEATLLVNEFNIMSRPESADRFWQLMTLLRERNAPFGAIGMQAHEPRTDRFPLANVVDALDRFAALRVPIHITEYSPTSGGQPITGGAVDGTWTEDAQADYAAAFYRICFGHPAVEAITWWDLWDRH